MPRIGYEFTVEDRKLLQSLSKTESGISDVRKEAQKMRTSTGKAFDDVSQRVDKASTKMSGFKNILGGIIAADVVRQGARLLKEVTTAAIGAAASYEQLQVSFTTFLQSEEKANTLLKELTETAANTPFEQDEIYQGARQLLAYGVAAEDVNQQLITLGDLSAGVGQPLQRIVNIFGQVQAKTKLMGEELRQLNEAGINPLSELAEVLGVAEAEVQGLISKGRVSGRVLGQAFEIMTSEGGRFYDLMQKQSETYEGRLSNLKDQLTVLARDLGNEVLPLLKEGLDTALKFTKQFDTSHIKEFGKSLRDELAVLKGIGKFFGNIRRRIQGVTLAEEIQAKTTKEVTGAILSESNAMARNIKLLQDLNSTEQERKLAIAAISKEYPGIIANYDLESRKVKDLTALQGELKDAIIDRIKEQRTAEIKADLQKELERIATTDGRIFRRTNPEKDAIKLAEHRAKRELEALEIAEQRLKVADEAAEKMRAFQDLQQGIQVTQEEIDAATAQEVEHRTELEKLSDKELRNIIRSKDTDEFRKKIAKETLATRAQAANAAARFAKENKKAADEAQKALDKYAATLAKIAANLDKGDVDLIQDPILKLNSEKDLALTQLKATFAALRAEAKDRGQDITEVDDLEARARRQIWIQYYRDLKDQRKKDAEDALEKSIAASELAAGFNAEDLRGSIQSDGVNTKDELLRIALLERELQDLEELQKKTATVHKEGSDELEQIRLDHARKLNEISEAKQANQLAALGREHQHLLAEIDLIETSGEKVLSLEEFKNKKVLEADLMLAKAQLKLLSIRHGDNSPEVQAIKDTIAAIEQELNNFTGGGATLQDDFKNWIGRIFNISRPDVDRLLGAVAEIYGSINQIVADNTQFQIDQNQKVLDSIRERITETESALEEEQEAQKNGYAANVESKQAELDELKEQEKKFQKEQTQLKKQQLKQQLFNDSLIQVNNLITAASAIIKSTGGIPVVGIALAAAAIASMVALFAGFKNQAKSLVQPEALFKGGRIPWGRTDKNGARGHRIEGTNLQVGGGEMVVKRSVTDKHSSFLDDLNDGRYDHLDVGALLDDVKKREYTYKPTPIRLGKQLSDRVSRVRKEQAEAQAEQDYRVRKEVMTEVFSKEIDRLIQHADEKPDYIPMGDGFSGYIEKRKNHTRKVNIKK